MDADRFDTLARALSAPRSRRAALSSAAAGGLLSALGLTRAVPETRAAQGGLCVVAFSATTPRTGEVTGTLSFSLSGSGSLDTAALTLPDGTQVPVVGQATGHALQLRIALGAQQALVAVGVGEQEISRCQGAIDGVATGSQRGDLGDWHATAGVQNVPGGGQGTAAAAGGTNRAPRGGGNQGSGSSGGRANSASSSQPASGANARSCPRGQTFCDLEDGYCADLQTDALNCGACGTICPVNNCSGGVCGGGGIQNCAPPFAVCNGACVNLQTDPLNCGACGKTCPAGETCVGGKCAPPTTGGGACPEGQVRCGGTCQEALPNFGTDGLSCPGGAPPTECPAGRVLCNGACFPDGACQPTECQPGWGYCYGVCRDFQNDPGACGGCSTGCTGGICSGGKCVTCPAGQTPCGAACVDTKTDLNNCGFCGNLCGTQCIDGQCTGVGPAPVSCAQSGESCASDPCCVGFCSQDEFCECVADGSECAQTGTGGCCNGQPCNANGFCGTCALFGGTCNSDAECCTGSQYGAALCCFDGVSLTTRCTDVTDIGFVCPGDPQTLAPTDPQTLAPTDVGSCPTGQSDCGGVCADLSFDSLNCGGCGLVCGPDLLCNFGVCGGDPAALTAPEDGDTTCVTAGGTCDPGSPDACCSGACNDDGTCA